MPTPRHRAPGLRLPSGRAVAALGLVAVAVLGVGSASASRLSVTASSGGVASGVGTVTGCEAAVDTAIVLQDQPNPDLVAIGVDVTGLAAACVGADVAVHGWNADGALIFSSSTVHAGGDSVRVGGISVPASTIANLTVVIS